MTFAKLSKKQAQIFRWCYSGIYSAIICDGAVRSGKTVCMITSFILWAMKLFNGATFGICGKTVASVERNIIMPLMAIADITAYFKVNYITSSHKLIIEGCGRRNVFYVFGGKDESSYMLIQGITLSGVFFDEVALMPRSFVEQAITRTLSIAEAKLWFNCNPDNQFHWFYTDWIKRAEERNALHLHFLMSDNPILTPEQLDRAEKQFTGVFYDRYIRGLWVAAEGAIYRTFAENVDSYYILRDKLPYFREICVGVDFGGNKSQHAFVASGLPVELNAVYVLRSRSIVATGTSVTDIVMEFKRFCEGIEHDYGCIDFVFADSAEQAIINEMRANTKYDICNSIKNEIIDRIRCEDTLISQRRLWLVAGENNDLEDGLKCALWDGKKHDDVRLDDGTTNIDILDAFEYSWENNIAYLLEG
jgi:PBSX family phage terminase large subunit